MKDLGVHFSSNSKQGEHIRNICKSAYVMINMLFRCFVYADLDILVTAFRSYVRPLLEYCTPVWSPGLLANIDELESVQRYFTRRLFARLKLQPQNYIERLSFLELEPLERRRLINDLVMC